MEWSKADANGLRARTYAWLIRWITLTGNSREKEAERGRSNLLLIAHSIWWPRALSTHIQLGE